VTILMGSIIIQVLYCKRSNVTTNIYKNEVEDLIQLIKFKTYFTLGNLYLLSLVVQFY
jgi:hypothetical protein